MPKTRDSGPLSSLPKKIWPSYPLPVAGLKSWPLSVSVAEQKRLNDAFCAKNSGLLPAVDGVAL